MIQTATVLECTAEHISKTSRLRYTKYKLEVNGEIVYYVHVTNPGFGNGLHEYYREKFKLAETDDEAKKEPGVQFFVKLREVHHPKYPKSKRVQLLERLR